MNSFVRTKEDGRCKVIAVNVIDKSVRVETREEGIKSYNVEDLISIEEFDKKKKETQAE